jgi:hypothetical protein
MHIFLRLNNDNKYFRLKVGLPDSVNSFVSVSTIVSTIGLTSSYAWLCHTLVKDMCHVALRSPRVYLNIHHTTYDSTIRSYNICLTRQRQTERSLPPSPCLLVGRFERREMRELSATSPPQPQYF